MKNLLLTTLGVIAVILSAAERAEAVPKLYEIGGGSVNANTGSGLQIDWALDSDLPGTSFTLDNWDTFTFDFFKIWTDETDVGLDDMAAKPITATLNFTVPDFDANIGGDTVGISFFGIIEGGAVVWENPAPIFTAGDRKFSIDLSDATFNGGYFGLNEGWKQGATITATVKQKGSWNNAPASQVPDSGSTVILLGLSMVGFEGLRRISARKTAAINL